MSGQGVYVTSTREVQQFGGGGIAGIARWDGITWTMLAMPSTDCIPNSTYFGSVAYRLATRSVQHTAFALIATSNTPSTLTCVARIDGADVTLVPNPLTDGQVQILSISLSADGRVALLYNQGVVWQESGAWHQYLFTHGLQPVPALWWAEDGTIWVSAFEPHDASLTNVIVGIR